MPDGTRVPYSPAKPFETFITGTNNPMCKNGVRDNRKAIAATGMTIEGELNKLATNVAMGRTMGGVHWRTDNARSLTLGEALAAHILADITTDLQAEKPQFVFRTFARDANGQPKIVRIHNGNITVNDQKPHSNSALFAPQ